MKTGRIEAFSDGVLAIIITIMVLELKVPEELTLGALKPVTPTFIAYVLSFCYVGIYWNNHHHLFHAIHKVNGRLLWSNLHLLFWISLFPFVTEWIGENFYAAVPLFCYGFVLFMAAIAFKIVVNVAIKEEGESSDVGVAFSRDKKIYISMAVYFIGMVCAFCLPIVSIVLYFIVAGIWFVPEKRIEKKLHQEERNLS